MREKDITISQEDELRSLLSAMDKRTFLDFAAVIAGECQKPRGRYQANPLGDLVADPEKPE